LKIDLPELLKGGVIAACFTCIGAITTALVRVWRKPSAPAEMIEAAAAVAEKMIAGLERRVEAQEKRIGEVEAQNARCEGENRQLWSAIWARDRIFRENGIPIPASELPNALVVMEGDRVTVTKMETKP